MRISVLLLGVAVLAGCAQQLPPPQVITTSTPFDPAQAAFIHDDGPNTIEGQAFLRQRNGGVVTCAGETVYLVPVTDHAIDRFRLIYGSVDNGFVPVGAEPDAASGRDPEYDAFKRTTTCDAEGDFIFERLADGEYFVTTSVYWEVLRGYEGGTMARRVVVENGEAARLLLTR